LPALAAWFRARQLHVTRVVGAFSYEKFNKNTIVSRWVPTGGFKVLMIIM